MEVDMLPERGTTRSEVHPSGFTILELLITSGIMSFLMALLLPAISSAREAARGVECSNHLRQIGLAIQLYHDTHRSLPVGWAWEPQGRSAYGWGVSLLPYVEQPALARQIARQLPLNDLANLRPCEANLAIFQCPSDMLASHFSLEQESEHPTLDYLPIILPAANYMGVFGTIEPDDETPAPLGDGAFLESRSVTLAEFRRGTSQTMIVGERTMAHLPSTWLGINIGGEDAACRLVGMANKGPNCTECDECEFTSRHPQGVNFLWADGHVQRLSNSINQWEYQVLSRR